MHLLRGEIQMTNWSVFWRDKRDMNDKFAGKSVYVNAGETIAVIWMFWRFGLGWYEE